jgi:hypothetical protein
MKKINLTLFVLAAALQLKANDGAYYSSGGVIYPLNETRISIEKEILSFSCADKRSQVNVYFEFLNPLNTPVKTLVGFVAPLPGGDVNNEDFENKRVQNFVVQFNGKILPYELKASECSDCELKELSELNFSQLGSGTLVYLFELEFVPGINKVSHSYDFYASSAIQLPEFYRYTLTTGAKWAGGKIKDLTVEINIGVNKFFYVTDIFKNNATWSIIGTGKVTDKILEWSKEFDCKMIRILSGKLKVEVKDFNPEYDLEFGVLGENGFTPYHIAPDYQSTGIELALEYRRIDFENTKLTKEDLRFIRNGVYAQYGYDFKSMDLKDYFLQYEWYMPNPNLKLEAIKLSDEDKVFIEQIIEKEKLQ